MKHKKATTKGFKRMKNGFVNIKKVLGMKNFILIVFTVFIVLFSSTNLFAQWSSDTQVNTPVSTTTDDQSIPQIISDDTSGAIIVWRDQRDEQYQGDIYAQRIDSSGYAKWTADGVALCTATGMQDIPMEVSDGEGGAIVAWKDNRVSGADIYAQRINSSGSVMWMSDGVPVCAETDAQILTGIISDGAGGAIIVWQDYRSGTDNDIYAQRIDGNGILLWTSTGVPVCTASNEQVGAQIVGDGAGGAIMVWDDRRTGKYAIYAQKINSNGAVLWTADGVAADTAGGSQFSALKAKINSDGNGGVIIAWADSRNGNDNNVFAQRINSNGVIEWRLNGEQICDAADDQQNVVTAEDNSGGAIISWMDFRNGSDYNIYAQRVDINGNVQWTSNGVPICEANDWQGNLETIYDGYNGAVIAWLDYRNGDYNIYCQRVISNGTEVLTLDGEPVCTATGYQFSPKMITDGSGRIITVWYDDRGADDDIYAQRTVTGGYIPVELISFTARANNNTVELSWATATELNNYGFEIERKSLDTWEKIGFVEGSGSSSETKYYNFIDKES